MASSFVPAELGEDHYRPIGGVYDSFEKAMTAVEQHFRNKHGGSGSFQVYRPENPEAGVALIEMASTNNDPLRIRALYKIMEQRSGG